MQMRRLARTVSSGRLRLGLRMGQSFMKKYERGLLPASG